MPFEPLAIESSLQSDLENPAQPLSAKIRILRDRLRAGQQRMADWQGGALAVSAVPGSGKSTGMAIATAILLAKRHLEAATHRQRFPHSPLPERQLILVTFTRSAAANLRAKIRTCLRDLSLSANGFSVSTLHGLALSIANRHPDLSGLNLDSTTLVTVNQSNRLIRTCVEQWIAANPWLYQQLLEGRQFDGEETERLRRQSVLRTEVLPDLALTVVREAKSSGLSPETLRQLSQETTVRTTAEGYDVLAIAAGLYEQYQTLLQQHNFIDYDDMILAALRVLENDEARRRWQSQVFAVCEDEAQDSSPLQTELLRILAADPAEPDQLNLIRVGDPNQAINSTFTPADPLFFREFCEQCAAQGRLAEMDQAGRSTPVIMEAANALLKWVNDRYRVPATPNVPTLSLPFRPQVIRPVPTNDPQEDANPVVEGYGLEIRFPRDIHHSVQLIGQRVVALMGKNPGHRAAVLVRENRQGKYVADLLRNPKLYGLEVDLGASGIEVYDVGERDRHSHVPAEIFALLQFLDRPHSPDYLKAALRVLVDRQLIPAQDLDKLSSQPEQFLYPGPLDAPLPDSVQKAQYFCCSLLHARLELPQFQLIPFLALTLRYDQTELATADKLAARVTQQTSFGPSMANTLEVLGEIVRAERFEPVETDDPDARYTRPGQLTVITMHKAKGLDWDYVFIPFLHEQSIPGRLRMLPQAQFLGEFNLSQVARAQIRASVHQQPIPDIEAAWHQAGYLQTAEEFRLLYVAMTRAKRLLWMSAEKQAPFTWNKPDNLEEKLPCPALPMLVQKFSMAMSS